MNGNGLTRQQEKELARRLLEEIRQLSEQVGRKVRLMEVCGTHTVEIFRAGLRQLLPEAVELVSGPGCPVCVTPDSYMDKAVAYALDPDIIVTTFGDMLKVPGSSSSLAEAQATGGDVRIVYSPLDSLKTAAENPAKRIVFLAVGFETTAPTAAATLLAARQQGLKNFYLLSAEKLVPPAMRHLLADEEMQIDGFLLPGHVAVVTGSEEFRFLAEEYHLPAVVAGFKPLELLRAVYRLMRQLAAGEAKLENEYGSVVTAQGNVAAQKLVKELYGCVAAEWRGLGRIADSGLQLREEWAEYDIERLRPLKLQETKQRRTACRCGEVLQGKVTPLQCPLFGGACVPEHAIGPCMVSVEGVCAAWYKYGGGKFSYDG